MTIKTLTNVASSHLGLDISAAALVPLLVTDTAVTFLNNGSVGLIVNNGTGGSINVTPVIPYSIEGLAPITTLAPTAGQIALPASKTWLFGSYSPAHYNAPGGLMTITISGLAVTILVALISIPTTSP